MMPVPFPKANLTLKGPPNFDRECGDLHAERIETCDGAKKCGKLPGEVLHTSDNAFVSCWELTGEELVEVLQSKRIWLVVFADAHPPVMLTTDYPVLHQKPEGESDAVGNDA